MLTPASRELSGAIAAFRVKNKQTSEVTDYLMKQHKIFTVSRDIGKEKCVRVTPSIYNSADDIKKLTTALRNYSS